MKWTPRATATLVLAAALVGCGEKKNESAANQARNTPPASDAVTKAPAADAGAATGGEIQLAGTLGCGHCVYGVTKDCAAVVKTASGDMYVLDGIDEKSPLWEKRLEEGHRITVAGTVVGGEPLKHIAMTSFDLK